MVIETPPRVAPSLRWLLAALLACLPVLTIYLTYRAWSPRLPDPLPTHWGLRGQVDGTTTVAGFLTVVLAIAAAGGLLAVTGAVVTRLSWRTRRAMICVGAGTAGFAAGLWLVIAGLSLDHTDASQVPTPTWHIPVMLLAPVGWAGLAFAACGPAPPHPAAVGRPGRHLPRADVPPGQRVAWSEVTYPNRKVFALTAGVALLAIVIGAFVHPWVASPVVLSGLLILYLFATRLVVGEHGVQVGFGPWGWPRLRIPLTEIGSAEITTIRPMEWGGWGYRIRPGGRAVITRGGPGVKLALSASRVFVTSTRDPETVAGVINTLLDRLRR